MPPEDFFSAHNTHQPLRFLRIPGDFHTVRTHNAPSCFRFIGTVIRQNGFGIKGSKSLTGHRGCTCLALMSGAQNLSGFASAHCGRRNLNRPSFSSKLLTLPIDSHYYIVRTAVVLSKAFPLAAQRTEVSVTK